MSAILGMESESDEPVLTGEMIAAGVAVLYELEGDCRLEMLAEQVFLAMLAAQKGRDHQESSKSAIGGPAKPSSALLIV